MNVDLVTFVFQAINFVVLVLLLRRFLFRPIVTHMKARSERLAKERASIEEGRGENARAKAELETALAGARQAEGRALSEAETKASAKIEELLREAREAAELERSRQLATITQEIAHREMVFFDALRPLLERVVRRLVAEVSPHVDLHAAACERMRLELARLAPDERSKLEAAAKEGRVSIASATGALPEALHLEICALVGRSPIEVSKQPEILAGARLHIQDHVVDGSMDAQIRRILVEERS